MGLNGRKIKNRLRSVDSTKHMTKAMELVASSKLRKATANMESGRCYFEEMEKAFSRLISQETKDSVFVKSREVNRRCVIVIAGDRGLAGGYNNNVFKTADAMCAEGETEVLPIGKKAVEHYQRRGFAVVTDKYASAERITSADCREIGALLAENFASEKYDEITVVYTRYISILSQMPASRKLLPLQPPEDGKDDDYIMFSPDSASVLEALIPEYLSGSIYGAVSESFACELSARRNAMDSATKNASEMIEALNLQYNRARQAAITQEITEIIGGSEV